MGTWAEAVGTTSRAGRKRTIISPDFEHSTYGGGDTFSPDVIMNRAFPGGESLTPPNYLRGNQLPIDPSLSGTDNSSPSVVGTPLQPKPREVNNGWANAIAKPVLSSPAGATKNDTSGKQSRPDYLGLLNSISNLMFNQGATPKGYSPVDVIKGTNKQSFAYGPQGQEVETTPWLNRLGPQIGGSVMSNLLHSIISGTAASDTASQNTLQQRISSSTGANRLDFEKGLVDRFYPKEGAAKPPMQLTPEQGDVRSAIEESLRKRKQSGINPLGGQVGAAAVSNRFAQIGVPTFG